MKIKRDAKKMLGDEIIKASVTSSMRNNRCAEEFCQTSILLKNETPGSQDGAQGEELQLPSEGRTIPEIKIDDVSGERPNVASSSFSGTDLPLGPKDLNDAQKGSAEIHGQDRSPGFCTSSDSECGDPQSNRTFNEVATLDRACNNVSPQNEETLPDPDIDQAQSSCISFLSLMRLVNDDSEPDQASAVVHSSRVPRFPQLPPSVHSVYSTVTIPPTMPPLDFSSASVYHRSMMHLHTSISYVLNASEARRLELMNVAKRITAMYKKHDQFPDGFFERVPSIQRNFLVRV